MTAYNWIIRAYKLVCKLLKDWFTGVDNEHYDMGRFLWFAATAAAIIYPGVAMFIMKQEFDVQEFCIGLAAILAAGGFGVAQKDNARTKAVEVAAEESK